MDIKNEDGKVPDYDEAAKTAAQKHFEATRASDVARVATEGYSVGRPQVAKVRYSHDAMVDLLIANPGISQNKIAKHFGYTAAWVCTIMASDAFQVRLASRRHELVDPTILATIEERYRTLATVSVTKLIEHMNRPEVEVDPEILIKAAALGAKSLGIGGHAPPQAPKVDENQRLALLADKLTGLLKNKRDDVIDVVAKDIGNA